MTARIPPADDAARAKEREAALRLQVHSHKPSCGGDQDAKKCRYCYPRPVSEVTRLREPTDTTLPKNQVLVYKRGAEDIYVNPFNPTILTSWLANMDLQIVGGYPPAVVKLIAMVLDSNKLRDAARARAAAGDLAGAAAIADGMAGGAADPRVIRNVEQLGDAIASQARAGGQSKPVDVAVAMVAAQAASELKEEIRLLQELNEHDGEDKAQDAALDRYIAEGGGGEDSEDDEDQPQEVRFPGDVREGDLKEGGDGDSDSELADDPELAAAERRVRKVAINCVRALIEYACGTTAGYVTKAETVNLRRQIRAALYALKHDTARKRLTTIGMTLVKTREISAQEAVWTMLGLPYTMSSRTFVKLNTYMPDNRMRLLKPMDELAKLPPDSDDIFAPNILDRYAKRPKSMQNMCLIDFARWYKLKAKKVCILLRSMPSSASF
jgi:hypothetical protein